MSRVFGAFLYGYESTHRLPGTYTNRTVYSLRFSLCLYGFFSAFFGGGGYEPNGNSVLKVVDAGGGDEKSYPYVGLTVLLIRREKSLGDARRTDGSVLNVTCESCPTLYLVCSALFGFRGRRAEVCAYLPGEVSGSHKVSPSGLFNFERIPKVFQRPSPAGAPGAQEVVVALGNRFSSPAYATRNPI